MKIKHKPAVGDLYRHKGRSYPSQGIRIQAIFNDAYMVFDEYDINDCFSSELTPTFIRREHLTQYYKYQRGK